MPQIKEPARSSKSSNEQSFQALNDITDKNSLEEHLSRPSQSSDFQSINQKALEDENQQKKMRWSKENRKGAQPCMNQYQLSQIPIQEQIIILRKFNKEKDEEISLLKTELTQYKRKNAQLQHISKHYKSQYQNLHRKTQKQLDVSNQLIQNLNQKVNFLQTQNASFKKKTQKITTNLNTKQKQITEQFNQFQITINSLKTKLQFFTEQQKKTRKWLQNYLKINPNSQKLKMNLSTLVESALIDYQANLKELSREIEQIMMEFKIEGYQRLMNKNKERYNHWQAISNLEEIKGFIKKKLETSK